MGVGGRHSVGVSKHILAFPVSGHLLRCVWGPISSKAGSLSLGNSVLAGNVSLSLRQDHSCYSRKIIFKKQTTTKTQTVLLCPWAFSVCPWWKDKEIPKANLHIFPGSTLWHKTWPKNEYLHLLDHCSGHSFTSPVLVYKIPFLLQLWPIKGSEKEDK